VTEHSLDAQALRLLETARSTAAERGETAIAGEHLLAALFRASEPARRVLASVGIDADRLADDLLTQARPPKPRALRPDHDADATVDVAASAELSETPASAVPEPTSQTRRLLALASRLAPGDAQPAGERELLLAAAQEPRGPFARALNAANISLFALRQAAVREVDGEAAAAALVDPGARRRANEAVGAETPGGASADSDDQAAADARREARKAGKQAAREERDAKRQQRSTEQEAAEGEPSPIEARAPKPPKEPRQPTTSQETASRGEPAAGASDRRQKADDKRGATPRAAARAVGADAMPPEPKTKTPSIGRIKPEKPGLPWRALFLLAVPVSIGLSLADVGSGMLLFIITCVAVLPLAGYMGEATEHLAARTNPTVGGLLNATFGNAAELIIAAVALRSGYVELVKASIIGSILGNLLLILGLAIIAGGLNRPRVRFNRTGAGMSAGMLALAVVGLVFPALLHALRPDAASRLADELHLSEVVAGILIVTYLFSLLFTLKTHQRLLGGEPHPTEGDSWSVPKALGVLVLATVFVGWESEILVHSVEAVTRTAGIPEVFLGLILVPLIGNASEHAAAIAVARKGKMDLAFQIALGSSTQIALLVAPLLVFLGLAFGQRMDLVFTPFEVAALGLSVLVASIVTLDGESHWFEGVQLLAVYLMVAAAAFFL